MNGLRSALYRGLKRGVITFTITGWLCLGNLIWVTQFHDPEFTDMTFPERSVQP